MSAPFTQAHDTVGIGDSGFGIRRAVLEPPGEPSRVRLVRIATALWLIFAFIVWNDLFDAYVRGGMYEYLTRTALYEQGFGARVTIDEMMHPAIANGLRVATLYGLATAAAGIGLVRWAAARQKSR